MNISSWLPYFQDRGIPPALTDIYVEYADRLQKKGLPVVYEFEHLSLLLGVNIHPLANMVASPSDFYREFSIPKRSGGRRQIFAPHKSLLHVQRWILSNILNRIEINEAAHGFRKNRSIKSNASVHLGSKNLLKMDIKNFFPSIDISWIINVFKDVGYAPNVAYYLASLCCYRGVLAQGAATSPALSNIILRSLDNRLGRLAKKCSLQYSRYADDLTFSGDKIHHSFSVLIEKIVKDYGLEINNEKTRLKIDGGARIITGISISKGQLSIPKKFKRDLKNEIFFIKRFGLLSHMSNKKIKNPNYLNSLLGKVNFWIDIEPENESARSAKRLIRSIMNS